MDLPVGILKDGVPAHLHITLVNHNSCIYFTSHLDLNLVGDIAWLLELLLEVLTLPLIVPAVGDRLPGYLGVGDPGILPLSDPGVVVDKENPAISVDSLLPTLR